MPEENKIDYTGIQVPNIESVRKTVQQFTDWRRSMGFQTEEEKNAALKAEMQAAQQRFNDQDLWNSEDPYEVYNAYEIDPAKQAEFQRNGQMVAGVGSTIATLPFTAGMMGWVPALTTTATGAVGGYAGAYGGQKLGQHLDNKYGWNTTPWLSTIGGIGGGILGGGLGYRGTVRLGSRGWLPKGGQTMYSKQFVGDVAADALTRQLKKAPSKTMMDYYRDYNFLFSELTDPDRFVHVSPNPISGKNVSVGAAHSNGVNWVPGNAHVSKVGDDNMVWLWTGKPYRNRSSDQTFISIPKTEDMVQTRQPGAVGVPQIDLTHNTTKIITKNPITGGFERQLVISPAQSSKGSYALFERPSTYFKDTTYAGKPGIYDGKEVPTWQLPKGQRNQPINVRTPSQEFSNKYISSKMSLRKPTYDYEDLTENYFRDVSADEFNKRLKEYVSYARHKGSPITNEIAEPIVKGYRNYLNHLDFDAKDLSDDELRIILSKHFADLSRGASGKMKDQIVWHSSPTWFDEFDYRYTGKNMENSGAMGPGNYFSKEATMYGRGKKGEFSGKYDMGNTQPYIITDVMSTPSGKDMQNKGLLPTIIHKYRGRDRYGQKWNPDPEFDIKLKAQIDAVPLNDNKMYVLEGTDSGFDKLYQTPFGLPGGELMIRRNTGIKSLYPHPSRFVRDEDGFVHLIPTDWNDSRVNFKTGGKL